MGDTVDTQRSEDEARTSEETPDDDERSEGGPAGVELPTTKRRRGGFTSETARIAGQRGGKVVSQDRAHMSRIGRRGVEKRRHASNGDELTSAKTSAGGDDGGEQQSGGAGA